MKKILTILVMFTMCLCANAQSQYVESNGHFSKVGGRTSAYTDTLVTKFTIGTDNLPIIVRKNDGYCYVWKTTKSGVNAGKKYRAKVDEGVAKAVCAKLGIKYTYIPRTKKS